MTYSSASWPVSSVPLDDVDDNVAFGMVTRMWASDVVDIVELSDGVCMLPRLTDHSF